MDLYGYIDAMSCWAVQLTLIDKERAWYPIFQPNIFLQKIQEVDFVSLLNQEKNDKDSGTYTSKLQGKEEFLKDLFD